MFDPKKIRNIAIIAHIDHGKTTLLDSLLKQSKVFQEHEKIPERVMDSYDQERERGITIFSKHTSIFYEDYKINIIDTPGHADFSGEVERILGMVNSVLLLVDAKEGPMPQTRFLLKKALQMGLKPIVVLNKVDRPHANPERSLNQTFDLFVELGATDEQLDFPYCYASGLQGFAQQKLEDPQENMNPLFELIVDKVLAPVGDFKAPFLLQASTLDYDNYLGIQVCGRILDGFVKKGMVIDRIDRFGKREKFTIQRIQGYCGLKKVEMEEAGVGDIVLLSGVEHVMIGDTLCSPENTIHLPPISIAPPSLSIDIFVNSGPFAGREGKNVTMSKIQERLLREKLSNATLKIDIPQGIVDKITVSGRGELHLSVLLEAIHREDFELLISKPQVILQEKEGIQEEPIEKVSIEVPSEYTGVVIEELGRRRGELLSLDTNEQGVSLLEFFAPTRGLSGCVSELFSLTKGKVIMTAIFDHYAPWKGAIPGRKKGVLISICSGVANGYACFGLQKRATLFVKPGNEVYEGMIVGENSRENDLVVNVTKEKHLTNVRAAGKDENILLTPCRVFTLEEAINFIADDEFVEITPKSIRLRKRALTEQERTKVKRKAKA